MRRSPRSSPSSRWTLNPLGGLQQAAVMAPPASLRTLLPAVMG
jgi:hypothetical protein